MKTLVTTSFPEHLPQLIHDKPALIVSISESMNIGAISKKFSEASYLV